MKLLILFISLIALSQAAVPINLMEPDNGDACKESSEHVYRLKSYENTYFGYSSDSTDDLSHVDIKISLMVDIFRLDTLLPKYDFNFAFAFTSAFQFYLFQDGFSRPTIPTRLNPLLTFYGQIGPHHLWQVAVAHESNGQAINSAQGYNNADPHTRDMQISVAWNYLQLGYLYMNSGFSASASGRLFLGESEEYFAFEGSKPFKERKYSDTFDVRLEYAKNVRKFTRTQMYRGGYRASVQTRFGVPDGDGEMYGSVRAEAGYRLPGSVVTMVGWVHHGYNLTPVQYNIHQDLVVGGYLEFLIN